MKVSIGMKLQDGPWGGGNQFGWSLAEYLRDKGSHVFFDLEHPDLDLIVLTEPRSNLKSSAYSYRDIIKHLLRSRWQTIVVHRINECDERKGTADVNKQLIKANYCADYTVFISSWLKNLFINCGLKTPASSIILNGADSRVFNPSGYRKWNKTDKLRLVTHHWGGGYSKGFDIYERLDRLLTEPFFGNKLEFTYIGNLPADFNFTNAYCIPPQSGTELADSIRNNHVYLTASQNEPAGMHHIEGAMCGLPLLYRESGALPEYCQGFGISFTAKNFEHKLKEVIESYDIWAERMRDFPCTAKRMCENYYNLFIELVRRRDDIIRRRKWWRKPAWLLQTLLS